MNRNVILGIGIVVVFGVLLVVIWGSGSKTRAPAPAPQKPMGVHQAPEIPKPEPPAPEPARPPVEPAGEEPAEPADGETPAPGPETAPDQTTPAEDEGVKPDEGEEAAAADPVEKARITADTGAVDEQTREEAVEHQEVPAAWLGGETKAENEGAKGLPATYVLPSDMSLYRVAEILYGDADKWQVLLQANKAVLEDPEKVKAGTELQVPDPSAFAGAAPKQKKTRLSDGLH